MAFWPFPLGALSWAPPLSSGLLSPVTVTASGTAHTKGSWSELVAALSDECLGFWLFQDNTNANSTDTRSLLDIGIGASGSEVVVMADLGVGSKSSGGTWPFSWGFIPLALPSGARVAARMQSAVTSKTCGLYLMPVYAQAPAGLSLFRRCTTYGADSASSGGQTVTPDTAPTKGSWVQVSASTTDVINGFLVSHQEDATAFTSLWSIDIGVWNGSAYVVVVPDIASVVTSNEVAQVFTQPISLPQAIPVGSQIGVRAAAGSVPNYIHLHGLSL